MTTVKPPPVKLPAAAADGRQATIKVPAAVARLLARIDALCVRRGDRWVFLTSLGLISAGIVLGLVLPLTPDFISMHALPTNFDPHLAGKYEGLVTLFWVLSVSGYGLALWRWREGQRASMRLLVAGAVLLTLLALLVPPVASEDIYAYSFYGKVQVEYTDNPYLARPEQHPLHPWFPFWSWRETGPVYGPPFLMLLYGVALLAGPSLLAWVIWMKVLMTVTAAAGIWLLTRSLPGRRGPARPGGSPERGWAVLLLGWSPMVLQSIAMTAHVDAIPLLLVAGAILAHRRRRFVAAFLLLVGCFLIKIYLGPLAGLYGLWLAQRSPAGRRLMAFAGLGALGVAVTLLAYLPYLDAGFGGLTGNTIAVGEMFSTGSPANLLRRVLSLSASIVGFSDSAAATFGMRVARTAATVAVAVIAGLAARRLLRSPRRDPWPVLAWYFLGYLFATPWVFYWHEIPLLAIVAVTPWSLTALVAVIASVSLLPQAGGIRSIRTVVLAYWFQFTATLGGFLVYYASPLAVAWHGWRNARPRPAAGTQPPAPVLTGTGAGGGLGVPGTPAGSGSGSGSGGDATTAAK